MVAANNSPLQLTVLPDQLEPIITRVVEATIARLEAAREETKDQLCYSEPAAAALLDVGVHVLRDERKRSRIVASAIVGKRIRYLKSDLINYMLSRRGTPDGEK